MNKIQSYVWVMIVTMLPAHIAVAVGPSSALPPDTSVNSNETIGHPTSRMEFDSFFQKYSKYDSLCEVRHSTEFKEDALRVLHDALIQYNNTVPSFDPKDYVSDPLKFKAKVKELWGEILKSIRNHSEELEKNDKIKSKFSRTINVTLKDLDETLGFGFIPLPSFSLEVERSGGKLDYYRLPSLIQYFFMGFSPVSVKSEIKKNLKKRNEHPLSFTVFSNMYNLTEHDLQHAHLMGAIYSKYSLGDLRSCEAFQDGYLKTVQDIEERNKRGPKTRDKMALYYLTHEDKLFLLNRLPFEIYPKALAEFSLESTFNVSPDLTLDQLLNGNSPEICHWLTNQYSGLKVRNINEKKREPHFQMTLSQSIPAFDLLHLEELAEVLNPFIESESQVTGLELATELKYRLLGSLVEQCEVRQLGLKPCDMNLMDSKSMEMSLDFQTNIENLVKKEFTEKYKKEITAWGKSIQRVQKQLYENIPQVRRAPDQSDLPTYVVKHNRFRELKHFIENGIFTAEDVLRAATYASEHHNRVALQMIVQEIKKDPSRIRRDISCDSICLESKKFLTELKILNLCSCVDDSLSPK